MSEKHEIAFIKELNQIYEIIGRVTVYQYNTPQSTWGEHNSLKTHLERATKIESFLVDNGYEFDWFKGWTLEMVTTPIA